MQQASIAVERAAGSQGNGYHQREHGSGEGDYHDHHLVFDGDVGAAPSQDLPDHGTRQGHQSHDGDIGDERTERFDEGFPDERGLCFGPGGPIAQQVVVQLLFALQSAVIGIQGDHIARKHVSHQDTENGYKIRRVEHIVQLQYYPQEVKPHQGNIHQEPNGYRDQ